MILLRTLIEAYPDLSMRDRLHMSIRWRLCPFQSITAQVPPTGRIIDLGCGHGLFAQLLARQSPDRTVIGIDLDGRKIALARRLSLPNIQFIEGDVLNYDFHPATAITIVDTFYLIPYDIQERILQNAAETLPPHGILILKDMAERPRWKFRLNWLQETLAVKVFRITLGDEFFFRSVDEWQQLFSRFGFSSEPMMVDRGYYHPHVIFVVKKGSV